MSAQLPNDIGDIRPPVRDVRNEHPFSLALHSATAAHEKPPFASSVYVVGNASARALTPCLQLSHSDAFRKRCGLVSGVRESAEDNKGPVSCRYRMLQFCSQF